MKEIPTGSLYLGKLYDASTRSLASDPLLFESKNLTTHAVCVGMTGSGKTGLGVALLEEIALKGIPAIVIDPKGDLGNLLLAFPKLQSSDFLPWIDAGEAERHGQTPEKYAEGVAKSWKEGLDSWDETPERISQFKEAVDSCIYTPANSSGVPLSILSSFAAPSDEILQDADAMRERVLSTTSSLLGLLGIEADPIKSREHILISTLIDRSWREKREIALPTLIQQIQKPPIDKVGILDTDTFFPPKERGTLAMKLNNLLASPGFQDWMEGEPLNIQNLLYTKEGKPRLAIVTIAHLTDAERMFFVTLLLNELTSWMRRQTGSSSLRALLYMDEIFGYFPPNAMPPSKMPMLTLLKQARAFGLGIMLATQNPVDLDYKGLSNCGTWFIGKLQTERDKARVLEGLGSEGSLGEMIAACGNRVFILRSVHLKAPLLFQTRWALSYLRGPLTLPQIQMLMAGRRWEKPKAVEAVASQKPVLPSDVEEYFLPAATPFPLYQPKLLGIAKLHFVDSKKGLDTWQQMAFTALLDESGKALWGEAIDSTGLQKGSPQKGNFADIPGSLLQIKNYPLFSKSFADYLYQNQTFDLFEAEKMSSKPNESEADFRSRVVAVLKGQSEEKVKKIRDSYAAKIKILEDKIQKAEAKTASGQSQRWRQILDTLISALTTILGALSGKRLTKGSISQAGTTLRKAERIGKEHTSVSQAQETLESLQQQLQSLQNERDAAIAEEFDPDKIVLEKSSIHPRKTDIAIQTIALVWIS